MRKLLLIALVCAAPLVSQARDQLDGCGLGWEITEDETMIATTTRGTTNAFVPPTFGMTTGTLGCKKIDVADRNQESANYVLSNYVSLKQELAMGNGEYVDGLLEVMSCGQASEIKANYQTVVAPAKDGAELYNNLRAFCG